MLKKWHKKKWLKSLDVFLHQLIPHFHLLQISIHWHPPSQTLLPQRPRKKCYGEIHYTLLDWHGTQPEMPMDFLCVLFLPCPFQGTIFMFYLKLARSTLCWSSQHFQSVSHFKFQSFQTNAVECMHFRFWSVKPKRGFLNVWWLPVLKNAYKPWQMIHENPFTQQLPTMIWTSMHFLKEKQQHYPFFGGPTLFFLPK